MVKGTDPKNEDMFGTEYSITPDKLVKGMTAFVILIFLLMGILIPLIIVITEGDVMGALFFIAIMLAISIPTLYFSWTSSPTTYKISEKGVTIQRPWKPILIPIVEITKVEPKEVSFLKTMRAGNGGVFSISGKFYNKSEGWFRMYTKNRNLVMIHAAEKWVLSPDEREFFITDINGKLDKTKRGKGKKKARSE